MPAPPCATTSTAISTGKTTKLSVNQQEPLTLFQRLAIGQRSLQASSQAAQNCVCDSSGWDEARGTTHAPGTLNTGSTEADPSAVIPEPPSSQCGQDSAATVIGEDPPQEENMLRQAESSSDDEKEDVWSQNVMSVSNLEMSQALTSRIRLPDAVHVPLMPSQGDSTDPVSE
jgi:hypothetical protein